MLTDSQGSGKMDLIQDHIDMEGINMDKRFKEVLQDLLDAQARDTINQCIDIIVQDAWFDSAPKTKKRIVDGLEALKPIPGHHHLCFFEDCEGQPVSDEMYCSVHLAEHWCNMLQVMAKECRLGHPVMVLDNNGVALTGQLCHEDPRDFVRNKNRAIRVRDNDSWVAPWVTLPWESIRDIKLGR